ncbi:hypothetical protein EfmAA94_02960 [Enterococcus faecium]|nr:hypothetical protein EfmAA94_02960 [Enterococcus faecium]
MTGKFKNDRNGEIIYGDLYFYGLLLHLLLLIFLADILITIRKGRAANRQTGIS